MAPAMTSPMTPRLPGTEQPQPVDGPLLDGEASHHARPLPYLEAPAVPPSEEARPSGARKPVLSYLLLLVACLATALLSVARAAGSEDFTLWDVGCYLSALGAVLCLRGLLAPRTPPAASPDR